MRVWPYQMLSVLPSRHLLSQWRECLAISGCIAGAGLNHATVNRIKEYPLEHFAAYCDLVRKEFAARNYTIGTNTIEKLDNDINYSNLVYEVEEIPTVNLNILLINGQPLFENFHNERYLRQCFYMFQEKYDCDMLYEEEWKKIMEKFGFLMT